jgi:hypothetical protein
MTPFQPRLALAAVAALGLSAAALPGWAASSAASSVSDSITTSVGSVSTSFNRSSKSSSNDRDMADGDYKLLDVAAAPELPGMARLTLQAVAQAGPDGQFVLYLPEKTVQQNRLSAGLVIAAHTRPYGLELAKADDSRQAFFLVMKDAWYQELQSNPVTL